MKHEEQIDSGNLNEDIQNFFAMQNMSFLQGKPVQQSELWKVIQHDSSEKQIAEKAESD